MTAMTVDKGVLLGFVSSGGMEMYLQSRQFTGEVQFRVNDLSEEGHGTGAASGAISTGSLKATEDRQWGNYARGAVFALKKKGYNICKGIVGFVDGLHGLHGAGISSSAAIGISFLLALEHVNGLHISESENINLDRLLENDYLGLKNGILDQSAILLSKKGCLTVIHCKDKTHKLVFPQAQDGMGYREYKILLAFSGLRLALASGSNYNLRVSECQEAAQILLRASGRNSSRESLLSDVTRDEYEKFKTQLKGAIAKRARHFFTESDRVSAGIKAWASGSLGEFGRLMSESGRSSVENYECGCEPMIQLLEIILNAPGVFGARFSGAGFRGCCVALVATDLAETAAFQIQEMYRKVQPELAKRLESEISVLICDPADHAHVC